MRLRHVVWPPVAVAPMAPMGVLAVLAALAASASPVAAQDLGSTTVDIGGRVQAQYHVSSVDGEPSELFLRRVRPRIDVGLNDFLDGRLEVDFADGEASVKDAWVRMDFHDALRVSVGQFKRTFSVFDQSSSTDLPLIERDGRIAGAGACPGAGGICSFSRLAQKLNFDERDRGILLDGALGGGLSYGVTITNGEGPNTGDVNHAKSFSGRLVHDFDGARVAAFIGVQDHLGVVPDRSEETEWARAGGLDLEVGTWRDGFHLLAGGMVGENWKAGPEMTFGSVQALATWYADVGSSRIAGIEPLLRVDWTDPDVDTADDAGFLLTPGLMLYFTGKNGVSANLDLYTPQTGGSEYSFKVQTFLYFD